MAMNIDHWKALFAALAGAMLLGAVFWIARPALPGLLNLKPVFIAFLVPSYVFLMILRGLLLRALAPSSDRRDIAPWFRLAARHQLLFSLMPTAAGDIGFPYLANRIADLPTAHGMRLIAQNRLRDLTILTLFSIAGLVSAGFDPILGMAALLVGGLMLWFIDDVAILFLHVASKIMPNGRVSRFLRNSLPHDETGFAERLQRTLLSVAAWATAAFALSLAFRAAAYPLTAGETLLMLVALNAVGAVAFSIAGLGFSEAGMAGALIAIGVAPAEAAAVALVTRPLLLITLVSGCLVLDLLASLGPQRQRRDASRH